MGGNVDIRIPKLSLCRSKLVPVGNMLPERLPHLAYEQVDFRTGRPFTRGKYIYRSNDGLHASVLTLAGVSEHTGCWNQRFCKASASVAVDQIIICSFGALESAP